MNITIYKSKNKSRPSKELRLEVLERDKYTCVICGEIELQKLTIDHINPRVRGGKNELSNLRCLCEFCNKLKGKDIVTDDILKRWYNNWHGKKILDT